MGSDGPGLWAEGRCPCHGSHEEAVAPKVGLQPSQAPQLSHPSTGHLARSPRPPSLQALWAPAPPPHPDPITPPQEQVLNRGQEAAG